MYITLHVEGLNLAYVDIIIVTKGLLCAGSGRSGVCI